MQLSNSSNAVQSCCRWTGPDKFSQCLSICPWPPACSETVFSKAVIAGSRRFLHSRLNPGFRVSHLKLFSLQSRTLFSIVLPNNFSSLTEICREDSDLEPTVKPDELL